MSAFVSVSLLALAAGAAAISVSTTPHDSYSSSVGVLGCKIDTNRVAYWPGSVDCNNICVKLNYGDRSVHLLRIDQSGGAYDISYDAWAYLQTGKSATVDPITGGGVSMDYEEVDASECASLIHTDGSKLPLSASNSINFLSSCLAEPSSWVAQNHVLYNICDAICTVGYDETCTLDLSVSNQPSCSHTLGLTSSLSTTPVYNIEYQSGNVALAGSGASVATYAYAEVGATQATQATQATKATSTSSAKTTTTEAAVFVELTSTSTSVAQYSTTSAQTTSTKAAVVSSSSSVSSAAQHSTAIPSTTVAATSSYAVSASSSIQSSIAQISSAATYSNGTTTTSAMESSATEAGAKTLTTMSIVTLATAGGNTTSSSSAAAATSTPATGGSPKASVSIMALASGIAFWLFASAF
jgi:hypothetical protein